MPSTYAHRRFGEQVTALLPPRARRSARQFRRLYDVGLHGPDIFFYHNILFKDRIVSLAKDTHALSGQAFFTGVCAKLRQTPNEAALAYLYGVLAHYCLDSVVHPFVLEQSADGKVGHTEMETEFDRYLLQLDGKRRGDTAGDGEGLKLTGGECRAVSEFYDIGSLAVRSSVKRMAFWDRVTSMPGGTMRKIMEKCAGKKLRAFFISRTPNPNCQHLNEPMMNLYNRALEVFPAMVEALTAHLEQEVPLGELFKARFSG